jgi:hypothetical protein
MNWKNARNKPWLRKLLLVVSDVDREALKMAPDGRALLRNTDILVVEENDREFFQHFRLKGNAMPASGSLFLQDPSDSNSYVEYSEARTIISLERLTSAVELYQELGAKKVEILQVKVIDKDTKRTAQCDVKTGTISGDLKAKYGEVENLSNLVRLSYEFAGNEPNIGKAREILIGAGLDANPTLSGLVRMRENVANTLGSLENELCVTETLEKTIELVARINFPATVINAKAMSAVTERTAYFLKISVSFQHARFT